MTNGPTRPRLAFAPIARGALDDLALAFAVFPALASAVPALAALAADHVTLGLWIGLHLRLVAEQLEGRLSLRDLLVGHDLRGGGHGGQALGLGLGLGRRLRPHGAAGRLFRHGFPSASDGSALGDGLILEPKLATDVLLLCWFSLAWSWSCIVLS